MVHEGMNRGALDRIGSELSNALRFKSISHFLANISSIEIIPNYCEKSTFPGLFWNFLISIENICVKKLDMDLV